MQIRAQVRLTENTQQFLGRFGEIMRPAVMAGMELTMQSVEAEVVKRTPVDQGLLRASISGRVVDLWPRVEGIAGSPLPYVTPVELGSQPHWPPREPIQSWVRRKFGVTGKAMVSLAFLVARAISRRGTRPHHMFQQGLALGQQLAPRVIGAAVERVAQRYSDR